MSRTFAYKDRAFMVYDTTNVIIDRARAHCQRYGYTLSKLALIALAEKLEREENRDKNGEKGTRATKQATPTSPSPVPTLPHSPHHRFAKQWRSCAW
jgi:hypothetical protein